MYYEAAVVWQVGGIMLCGAVMGFDEKVATLQLLLFLLKSTSQPWCSCILLQVGSEDRYIQ